MKKTCELCHGFARMHCESDQASLCWNCDFKVHSANFLVARHSRTLLCHICQSPTRWTAAGSKIGPTVSVCDGRVCNYGKFNCEDESRSENYAEGNETEVDSGTLEDEDFESDDGDDEEDENEEEDEDIQVVPWSPSAPPPASASSSASTSTSTFTFTSSLNGEEESSSSSVQRCRIEPHRKRTREDSTDLRLIANSDCTNSQEDKNASPYVAVDGGKSGGERGVGSVTSVDSLPPPLGEKQSKRRRREMVRAGLSESRSWAIIESVKRWQRHEIKSSARIAKLCRLSEDPRVVGYDSSESS